MQYPDESFVSQRSFYQLPSSRWSGPDRPDFHSSTVRALWLRLLPRLKPSFPALQSMASYLKVKLNSKLKTQQAESSEFVSRTSTCLPPQCSMCLSTAPRWER